MSVNADDPDRATVSAAVPDPPEFVSVNTCVSVCPTVTGTYLKLPISSAVRKAASGDLVFGHLAMEHQAL